jgi:thiosulfate reductase cytochrome b subunit
LSEQRTVAKAGMAGSMAALFVTGFYKSRGARMLHPWFGWALLGFSIWHHLVSKPAAK